MTVPVTGRKAYALANLGEWLDVHTAGLIAAGFDLHAYPPEPHQWAEGDVLVTWDRLAEIEPLAALCEAAGGTVIVVQGAYAGTDDSGGPLWSMALGQPSGQGGWPVGPAGRWRDQHIELSDWIAPSEGRETVLVLGQRGVGPALSRMPENWDLTAAAWLRDQGYRVRYRPHPRAAGFLPPVEDALGDVGAAVTWHSAAGVRAICLGVPCYYGAPKFAAADAARRWSIGWPLPVPFTGPRERMLDTIAWGQWSLPEIVAGLPYRHLLGLNSQGAEA